MRKALALILILLVLSIIPAVRAEERQDLWAKSYRGRWDDGAGAVAIAPNGDIIVAGLTESFGAGWYDFGFSGLMSMVTLSGRRLTGEAAMMWLTRLP
jgi:hypothetical protein